MKQGQFPAIFNLSDLNGQNGFKLDGENNNDQSGYSVSGLGDINGDGYADLLVGAPYYPAGSAKGRSYVVFGGPGVGSSGDILLSSLNGTNGFKLDGENTDDYSGYSVSPAGDINDDGHADLLVGAYGYSFTKGRSYVVFGDPSVGSKGNISLSSLNGTNGFKLDGVGFSGISVSAAGDINSDGHADLLIGASGSGVIKCSSYVVFGGPGVGSSGNISLSSLNGTNGFKLNGENTNDLCGDSVSAAGDINGDGHADMLIGADGYLGGDSRGRTYVVFGGPGVGSSGNILLSGLNGTNGFKLDGENSGGDSSGISVTTIGDINGDGHADLLIGADGYHAGNGTGRSYVVFGGPGVGSSGDILLSGINGTNGFKLDGEHIGDLSGCSLSAAGDINSDGYPDLLIGANNRYGGSNAAKGRSYVVFGGPGVGNNGDILLSNLNGTNGFKLNGENNQEYSGSSVSIVGDINADGIADLVIGAYGYPNGNNTGRSYVVFGDAPPVLVNNTLTLYAGEVLPITSKFLAAYDLNHNNATLIFIPGNISHGYFSTPSAPSTPLMNFTQSQITNGSIQFVHDGSLIAPNYTMSVYSIGIAWTGPLAANVIFSLSTTSTLVSTQTTSPSSTPTPTSVSTLTPVSSGLTSTPGITQISTTPTPSVSVLSTSTSVSTQTASPSSTPIPTSVSTSTTVSSSLTSTFTPSTPATTPTPMVTSTPNVLPIVLLENQLTLSNDQTVVLSTSNLQADEAGFNNSQLIFLISNVQNGYFAITPSSSSPLKHVTSFTQAQIQNGAIEFVSAGNKQTPSYSVIASDGVQSTLPSFATINLIGAPNITQNSVNITVGSTITLTPAMLNVTAPGGIAPSQISLVVSNLQHGTITSKLTQAPVSEFTLADVEAGDIQFTQDGTSVTPSYTITATILITDFSSAPVSADVLLSEQGVYAPQLVNNYLTVTQGKAAILSNRYLSAQEPPNGQALGSSTMFYVSNIEYGHFSLINQPQTWITSFSQQQLLESQVQFVQDGSASTPSYQSQVEASNLLSASLPASIFFTPTNTTGPISSEDSNYTTIQKAIIGAAISGGMGIGFALIQICLKRVANRKLLQALGEGNSDYDQNVVRPVAQEIAARVKITGFLNATTNTRMRSFKSAVRSLLTELSAKGVNVNLNEMKALDRDAVINEIGNQTYRWVKSKRRGCTAHCPGFSGFFKPQIVPEDLQDAAPAIAEAVANKLRSRAVAASSVMELPKLSSSMSMLLSSRNSSQVPPPSPTPTVADNPNEEREVVQMLGS